MMKSNSKKVEPTDRINVYVCGAHSTGKTTLVGDVADALHLRQVKEIARKVFLDKFSKDDLDYQKNPEQFKALQLAILKEQACFLEKTDNEDFIIDRGIDPIVYILLFLGKKEADEAQNTPEGQLCIDRCKRKDALVFVVDPHQEILKQDGVRMVPVWEELTAYTKLMKDFLTDNNIPFYTIEMLPREERVQYVTDIISSHKHRKK